MLGHTFRHQLVVTVVLLAFSAYLFISLLFSCLFIMLFSYRMTSVYLIIILCILFICTSSPFTHTLTRSLSDDPRFAHPDIGRFVSIVQVFDETVRFARSWILPPFYSGILAFSYSCYYSLIPVYHP